MLAEKYLFILENAEVYKSISNNCALGKGQRGPKRQTPSQSRGLQKVKNCLRWSKGLSLYYVITDRGGRYDG